MVETLTPQGWAGIGSVSEVEPPGSMSTDSALGRRVIVFGWYQGKAGVYESRGGYDVESEAFRQIESLGLDLLSDLSQPYEFDVERPGRTRPGRTIRVRCSLAFTCPFCGRTSHNPNDVANRYCGNCHVWIDEIQDFPGG